MAKRIYLLATLAVTALTGAACASSDEAWESFRKDVAAACLAAAAPLFETPTATVDPFGSEHYGLALIRGKAKGADAAIAVICVYDKATKTAEVGGELPEEKAE